MPETPPPSLSYVVKSGTTCWTVTLACCPTLCYGANCTSHAACHMAAASTAGPQSSSRSLPCTHHLAAQSVNKHLEACALDLPENNGYHRSRMPLLSFLMRAGFWGLFLPAARQTLTLPPTGRAACETTRDTSHRPILLPRSILPALRPGQRWIPVPRGEEQTRTVRFPPRSTLVPFIMINLAS